MNLTPEQIKAMLNNFRQKGSYIGKLAEILGMSEDILREQLEAESKAYYAKRALLPRRLRLSREERLRDVMVKRYGVPEALVQAYDNEVKDYDW